MFKENFITPQSQLHSLPCGLSDRPVDGGAFLISSIMDKKSTKIERTCIVCDKSFTVYPSQLKRHRCDFCSNECVSKFNVGENNPNWKGGLAERKCGICGKEFKLKQKDVKAGGGKFCSRSCTGKNNGIRISELMHKKRIKKLCIICGKEIYIKQSHKDIAGIYCSKECMSIGYKERMKGKNNPNYVDGQSIGYNTHNVKRRRLVKVAKGKGTHTDHEWYILKKQYSNSCARCKKKEPVIKLTKDHIVPITKGGSDSIENIQPLCRRCNVKKFNKVIVYQHQMKIVI
jgi:hypothetical protein